MSRKKKYEDYDEEFENDEDDRGRSPDESAAACAGMDECASG